MGTHVDHQGHAHGCPSNLWRTAKARTTLPDPPAKIKNKDIDIIHQDDESLTVEWKPLLQDTTIQKYLVFWVAESQTPKCEVIYKQNISVTPNTTVTNPYYITKVNENCGATAHVIRSKSECQKALMLVGKSSIIVWHGVNKGIPGGCSVRGNDGGHFDKRGIQGTVGNKRSDLAAVCKQPKDDMMQLQVHGLSPQTPYYVGVAASNIGGIISTKLIGRTSGETTSKDTQLYVCHKSYPPDHPCRSASGRRPSYEEIKEALENTTETGQIVTVYPGVYNLTSGPLSFHHHRITFQGLHITQSKNVILVRICLYLFFDCLCFCLYLFVFCLTLIAYYTCLTFV